MLEKCVLTILELNWNQRLGHREDKIESLIVARVKFEPESSSSHESSSSQVKFSFFFSSFVFNCCVKIMYQRYEDSKILLFFFFVCLFFTADLVASTGIRVCLMCEPASHASQTASHTIHASQGVSHESHRFNV